MKSYFLSYQLTHQERQMAVSHITNQPHILHFIVLYLPFTAPHWAKSRQLSIHGAVSQAHKELALRVPLHLPVDDN
jgi:hypothetical protein